MRRHPKASAVGSSTRQAAGLGRSFRGAFEIRGTSGDFDGSGASPYLRRAFLTLSFALVLALALSSAASAAVAPKGVTGFFGTTGTAAGQMTTPRGVAVKQEGTGAGNVYAVDGANNRVVVFDANGNFLRAFGADVVNYGPDQADEVQAVDVNATAGNFKLTFNGQATGELGATASAAEVEAALNGLSTVGGLEPAGSVSVSGGPGSAGGTTPYKITFGGFLAATNVPQTTATNVSLSGGSPATAITVGTVNEGETGFEICVPANGDFCKAGTTGNGAGSMNSPQGIAVNQSSGDLYVTEQSNLRVQQFDSSGNFVRAFGQDVVVTGFPDNSTATSAVQTLTVTATEGRYKLKFGGKETGELPFNATSSEIQTALQGLTSIGSGNVTVSGAGPYTITFAGALANNPEPLITTESGPAEPLVGGTATVVNTTTGATGFEVCTAVDTDVCKAGVSGSTGGAFKSTFSGYPAVAPAGAPNAGDVLVADPANMRVQEFSSVGAFVRAFGQNVVNAGPDNNGTTNFEVCSLAAGDSCGIGAAGSGNGAFAASTPTRVAEDASGNLYTVEPTGNFRVQKFTLPGNSVTPQGPFDAADLTGSSAANAPTDVAVNPTANSNVLVTKAFVAGATPSCPITGAPSVAESRVLEVSSGGTLEGTHGTCAGITPVNGLAARQSSGNLYLSSTFVASRIYILNTGQPAAPTASITNVSGVGAHAVTVSAFVNPNGPELSYGQETTYKFEYKRSADPTYTPLGAGEASAGNRTTNKLITQQLEGLQAGTSYDVRLVATKPFGSGSATSTVTFATAAAAPDVSEPEFASNGATTYLQGEINPNGSATTYEFEYVGDQAFEQSGFASAASVPSPSGSIAPGNAFVFKSANVSGLEAGKTYRLRLTAVNGTGSRSSDPVAFTVPATGGCANEAIREEIRRAQEEAVSEGALSGEVPEEANELPNCMALEMASPPEKGQRGLSDKDFAISPDGAHVMYRTGADLAETGGVIDVSNGDVYVASRTSSGWSTTPTVLRLYGGGQEAPVAFAPDFSSWFLLMPESNEQNAESSRRIFFSTLDRTVTPFSSLLVSEPKKGAATFAGASEDLSHIYVFPGSGIETIEARYSSTDPVPVGPSSRNDTYIATLGQTGMPQPLQLLARDVSGKAWGGNCGARIGGDLNPGGLVRETRQRLFVQGAISSDGSRIYFSTRPGQPSESIASPPCGTSSFFGFTPSSKPVRILERAETPAGPVIGELFQSECNRVSPSCDTTTADDVFQGASADGMKVYFTSTRQLVDSDLDSPAPPSVNVPSTCGPTVAAATGCDLYLYEKLPGGGHTLVQVSAGDSTDPTPGSGAKVPNGIAAISTDGSHVYFVAGGVLTTVPNELGAVAQAGQPNLYLYERDAAFPGGHTAFIATVASTDRQEPALFGLSAGYANGAFAVPAMSSDGTKIGGDGRVFVFMSKAQLTGADSDGSQVDIYRYDSQAGSLRCVSCLPGGGNEPGAVFASEPSGNQAAGPDFLFRHRWVGEDGNTVAFSTKAALVPGDTNGAFDDYIWQGGRLWRLPATASGTFNGDTPTLSSDGSSVAFRSASELLPQDGDNAIDAYVARAGGGFPIPPAQARCQGEECQEPFRAQPSPSRSPSETATGGNVAEPLPVKCRKRFMKRNGRCIKRRHHKKRHHHRKKQHSNRRAAATSQGGQK